MANYIIYNGFWNPDTIPDPIARLVAAATQRGVALRPLPNTALTAHMDGGVRVMSAEDDTVGAGDTVLFWDKDVRLARAMEACGARLVNSADAVAVCDDKAATHLALAQGGIPMPKTLVAPMTYVHMDEAPSRAFRQLAAQQLGFPMVVKECYGSLGGQVYLARDTAQLDALVDRMAARPFLVQRFVASSAGRDKRLYMVGGRLVAAMRRFSDGDFRANIGNGGHGEAYTPTVEEIRLSRRCCELLGTDIAGVDILDGENGEPLVCEVNASAHMAELTACTGVDVAGAIIEFAFSLNGK